MAVEIYRGALGKAIRVKKATQGKQVMNGRMLWSEARLGRAMQLMLLRAINISPVENMV